MKSWTMFVIAIGCLLIATSPQLPSSMMYLVIGLFLVIFGTIRFLKSSKKNKR